ncbi:MAG: glycosyltransferase [Candidatus Scalindua sp.]|nr:glycosyltransferase [Candidatus Scalindua sp.]
MSQSTEKRKYARTEDPLPIEMRIKPFEGQDLASKSWSVVYAKNYSAGGVFLYYAGELEIGLFVELRIHIPKTSTSIYCIGKIIRTEKCSQAPGNGVAIFITEISNQHREIIRSAEKLINIKTVFDNNILSAPLVSIILLDWKCRESFHIFNYLNKQTVPREWYEIIWIEYYDRRPSEIEKLLAEGGKEGKPPILDKWIIMYMPDELYYHKHLMYNIGIAACKGEIVTICDSDGIVNPSFVESIIKSFEEDCNIVLHMDEVRNKDRRFYPFNNPSIEEIKGDGCINFKNGKTTGLLDKKDIIHTRNYGSCMCALREDLIHIGGADEHIDYLGHVCGPYEMTYRLVNAGKKEIWHQEEFLYHVWHPGTDGDDNYIGPHDGFNMSTTALEVRQNGRVFPLVENEVIRLMRSNQCDTFDLCQTINPAYIEQWTHETMDKSSKFKKLYHYEFVGSYMRYNILKGHKLFYAIPQVLGNWDLTNQEQRNHPLILSAETLHDLEKRVEQVPQQAAESYLSKKYTLIENQVTHVPVPYFVWRVTDSLVFLMHRKYKSIQMSITNRAKDKDLLTGEWYSFAKNLIIKLLLRMKDNRDARYFVIIPKRILKKGFRVYFHLREFSSTFFRKF